MIYSLTIEHDLRSTDKAENVILLCTNRVDDKRTTLAWKTDSTSPRKSRWQIAVTPEKRRDVLREATEIGAIALGKRPGNLFEIGLTGGLSFDQGWLHAVKLKHVRDPKSEVVRTWVDYRWYPNGL